MKKNIVKCGVCCDKYKTKIYKKAIKDKGYTILSITPGVQFGFDLITVSVENDKMNDFANFINSLERKYSQRNRVN